MLSTRKVPQQQLFSRLFLITDFLIIDFLNFLITQTDDDLLILDTEELFTTDIVDCIDEMFLNCSVIGESLLFVFDFSTFSVNLYRFMVPVLDSGTSR